MQFQKATRTKAKARIALSGPSGSGKTYTALVFARALANGGRVALIDTENESASLYADEFDFDTLQLTKPYSPDRYIEAIHLAEKEGYAVIVVDSLSHAWFAEGGVLDIVDKAKMADRNKDGYGAWRKGTPEQNKLMESLVWSTAHVIATLRSKQEYVIDKDEKTQKTKITKVGLAPVQREGLEYEFTIAADIDLEHTLIVSKSRMHALADAVFPRPGPEVAQKIREWLEEGAAAPERAALPSAPDSSRSESAAQPEAKQGDGKPDPAAAIKLVQAIKKHPSYNQQVHGVPTRKDGVPKLRTLLASLEGKPAEATKEPEAQSDPLDSVRDKIRSHARYKEEGGDDAYGEVLKTDDEESLNGLLAYLDGRANS